MNKLNPCNNHSHFAVDQNFVYEMYRTIKGLRYRQIAAVDYADTERLKPEDIAKINQQLSKQAV